MGSEQKPCAVCGIRPRHQLPSGKTRSYCIDCDRERGRAYYHQRKRPDYVPPRHEGTRADAQEQPAERSIPQQRADELRRLMAQQAALLRLQSERSATGSLPPLTNLYSWR